MPKFINLEGEKFGKLLVINKAHTDKHSQIHWLCLCDCGKEVIANGNALRRGATQSCGCYNLEKITSRFEKSILGQTINNQTAIEKEKRRINNISYIFYKIKCLYCGKEEWVKRSVVFHRNGCGCKSSGLIDLVGMVYGKLTVVEYAYKKRYHYWKCRCECGNEHVALGSGLRSGSIQSCGCLWDEKVLLKSDSARFENDILNMYKQGAKTRGYDFLLTKEEFLNLLSQNCAYCGKEPSNEYKGRILKRQGRDSESFFYNGVDRIDSSKGYTIDNTVSCCRICNIAKGTTTKKEFLKWIETVYKFNNIGS